MASPTGSQSSVPGDAASGPEAQGRPEGASDVVARMADFAELTESSDSPSPGSLDRLLDVTVTLTAELGRVSLSIGDILKLGVGSVLELNRSVAEPVDLIVQGVRLGRGEVVVVDDRFAIRIKEISDPKKRP